MGNILSQLRPAPALQSVVTPEFMRMCDFVDSADITTNKRLGSSKIGYATVWEEMTKETGLTGTVQWNVFKSYLPDHDASFYTAILKRMELGEITGTEDTIIEYSHFYLLATSVGQEKQQLKKFDDQNVENKLNEVMRKLFGWQSLNPLDPQNKQRWLAKKCIELSGYEPSRVAAECPMSEIVSQWLGNGVSEPMNGDYFFPNTKASKPSAGTLPGWDALCNAIEDFVPFTGRTEKATELVVACRKMTKDSDTLTVEITPPNCPPVREEKKTNRRI